jgi:hypothetical protein
MKVQQTFYTAFARRIDKPRKGDKVVLIFQIGQAAIKSFRILYANERDSLTKFA